MARTQGIDLRQPQRDRGLAPRRRRVVARTLAPGQTAAAVLAGFLAGVGTAGMALPAFAAIAVPVLAAAAVFLSWRGGFAAVLVLCACAAGAFYYHLYFTVRGAHEILPPASEAVTFRGIVSAEPGHSAKSEHFPLRLEPPWRGRIRVIAPPASGFRYGDVLELSGRLEPPEKERDLPVSFYPQIERVGEGGGSLLRRELFRLKHRLLGVFPRYLPSEEAAFLGGITLGARAAFSPEFIEALAASGTTHLVALSGYNIAILVFVVFGGCVAVLGRRAAFYSTVAVIFLFTVMVGAEPSVVRAAIMGCLILLARELGRPYSLPHALLWAAFIMTLFDPGVFFMPGFQLSFMALLGIVYLSPVVLRWFGGGPGGSGDDPAGAASGQGALPAFLGGFRENAALTISAQAAVAPVILNNFGGVPLASVIANAVILPFMPLTMFFGFALLACGLIFAPLGAVAGLAAHVLLAYETGAIRFFAALNLPVRGELSWSGMVLYYLALAWLVRWHRLHSTAGPKNKPRRDHHEKR